MVFPGGSAGSRFVSYLYGALCLCVLIHFSAEGAAPANDSFADRITITEANVPISGSTLEATQETGEPPGQLRTAWYTWTAAENERFSVVVEDATFVVNARLYTGNSLSTLLPVAPNILYPGGQTYHIQLGGQNASSGDYRFTIRKAGAAGAPFIRGEPDSRVGILGGTNFLSVNVIGENLEYQWFRGGAALEGATNRVLSFGPITETDAGEYFVRISNPFGTVASRVVRMSVHLPLHVQTLHVRDTNGALQRFDTWGISAASNGVIYIAGQNGVREVEPSGIMRVISAQIINGDLMRYVPASNAVYFTEGTRGRVQKIQDGVITTVAGASTTGYQDGPASTARFSILRGIVVGNDGTIYVADAGNNVIRKIQGGIVSTYAGRAPVSGARDGVAAEATFGFPAGLALDAAGNLYVADDMNHTIRKISTNGVVSTFAGMPGAAGTVDGQGFNARFNVPGGLVMDEAGNLLVTERVSGRIRLVTPDGVVATLTGARGFADGLGEKARLLGPYGIAVDDAGNFVIADADGRAVRRAFWWDETIPPIVSTSSPVTRGPLGSNFELTAEVMGTEPITLQWYRNNVAVAGATSAILPILNLSADNSGTYYLSASNRVGVTTSSNLPVRVDVALAWAPPVLSGADVLFTFGTTDASVPAEGTLTNISVQGSADLVDWQTFETLPTLTNGQHQFQVPASEPYRFFRTVVP